jgi:hypothetical protein
MSLGQTVTIQPDQYNLMLAENAKAAFIDQGFINTMRFSELNGDEEYDNTFLYAIWHGYLETGLQQINEYVEWILREMAILAEAAPNSLPFKDFKTRIESPVPTLNDVADLLDRIPTAEVWWAKEGYYLTADQDPKKGLPYDQKQRIYRFFLDLAKILEGYKTLKTMPPSEDGTRVLSAKEEQIEVDTFHHYMIGLIRRYLSEYNQNLVDFVTFYDCHIAILNGRMARGRGHKKELLQLAQTALERKPGVQVGAPEDDKKHWWSR